MTVLGIAEHRRGDLRDVSFELASVGRELADATDSELHLAVIGGEVEAFADDLDREGVDVIHTIDEGEEFNHDIYVQAVEALHDDLGPDVLLMPHSVNGLDYAPAVASRLSLPLVTDAIGVERDDGLAVTREMYGSKVETVVDVDADRVALTVRPGEWPPVEGTGDADVSAFAVDIDESQVRSTVTGFEEVGGGDVDITDADVLVSVGRVSRRRRTSHWSRRSPTRSARRSRPPARSSTTAGSRRTGRSASPGRSSRRTSTSRSVSRGRSSTSPG